MNSGCTATNEAELQAQASLKFRDLSKDCQRRLGMLITPNPQSATMHEQCNGWESVAEELGFEKHEIQLFRNSHTPGYDMLRKWSESDGTTIEVLKKVFRRMERDDFVEHLDYEINRDSIKRSSNWLVFRLEYSNGKETEYREWPPWNSRIKNKNTALLADALEEILPDDIHLSQIEIENPHRHGLRSCGIRRTKPVKLNEALSLHRGKEVKVRIKNTTEDDQQVVFEQFDESIPDVFRFTDQPLSRAASTRSTLTRRKKKTARFSSIRRVYVHHLFTQNSDSQRPTNRNSEETISDAGYVTSESRNSPSVTLRCSESNRSHEENNLNVLQTRWQDGGPSDRKITQDNAGNNHQHTESNDYGESVNGRRGSVCRSVSIATHTRSNDLEECEDPDEGRGESTCRSVSISTVVTLFLIMVYHFLTADNVEHLIELNQVNGTVGSSLGLSDIIRTGLFSLTILFGIPGNILTVIAVITRPALRNIPTAFIVNLALSDLLFLSGMPAQNMMALVNEMPLPNWYCNVVAFTTYSGLMLSPLNLALVAVNRCVLIVMPKHYSKIYTRSNTAVIIAAAWLWPLLLFLAPLLNVWGKLGYHEEISVCGIVTDTSAEKTFSQFYFYAGTIVPLIVMGFSYTPILWKLHQLRKFHQACERMTKIVLFLITFYCLTFIPFMLSANLDPKQNIKWLRHITGGLAVSNYGINPFVYGYMNRSMFKAYKGILKCRCSAAVVAREQGRSVSHLPSTALTRLNETTY